MNLTVTQIDSGISITVSVPGSTSAAVLSPGAALLSWPAGAGAIVTNGTYEIAMAWPWASGVITGLSGKTANGSFVCAVRKAGTPIAGLGAVSINSPTLQTTLAGVNTVATGDEITLVISAASGAPTDAAVQVTYTHSQA